MSFFIHNIIMSEKTLKFNNIKINKKKFHKSKQAINLDSVTTDKIVVSDKFRHSEEDYKYFIAIKKMNCQSIMYYLTLNEWLHKIF